MEKTNIGIIGVGTVGSGVARLLLDHGDRTARHAGRTLWLKRAVVRDLSKPRDVDLPEGVLTDCIDDVIDDPEIRVVAQLIGGTDLARKTMLRLLEAGKDVVTANKALLAEHGAELFMRARELKRSVAFEAAVAGGIPIIANISQCLSANQITTLEGILNGTSNFILDRMDSLGESYESAVQCAQEMGYAEADPTMDVDGTDAAQKLAILSHLAFGADVEWKAIPRVGIESIEPCDLRYARQLGYRIKLVGLANLTDEGLELSVAPTLVKIGTPLAEVRDAFNAISVLGDAVGPVFFHGQGAGKMPTASAVTADLIDTAVGRTKITFQTLEYFSTDRPPRVNLRGTDSIRSRLYLRMTVTNDPGTLAAITGVLAEFDISIASVIQHDGSSALNTDPGIALVVMTYPATRENAAKATKKIASLKAVIGDVVRYNVKSTS